MRVRASVVLVILVAGGVGAGCLAPAEVVEPTAADDLAAADAALALPTDAYYTADGNPSRHGLLVWPYPPFHTLEEIETRIAWINATYPDFVETNVIGFSREERPIRQLVVTNEARATGRDGGPKPAPLIDAGHHANELAGIEQALYVVEYLLENRGHPEIASMLDTLEIHVVPLVNPDGYVRQTRGNALGVNLNRNYDIDWGNPLGASNPVMGRLAETAGRPVPSVIIVGENCGSAPFSEPEASAMRDLMASLDGRLAFYLTMHTPTNGFVGPWSAYAPPFAMESSESAVVETIFDWVRHNTEYEAGKTQWGNFSAGLPYSASGSSQDWAYATHHVPAFTFELEIWHLSLLSKERDAVPRGLPLSYDGLGYWMAASLPVPMYLLANADELRTWQDPVHEPPLPDGVPPPLPADRTAWTIPDEAGTYERFHV
ncbi:MAG TPA: M14 family metallopeptidase [Candidatus Thermoplasmatota archaeon]|nr:M14 family metallopeptidase [Candidatus Thermoplasmatota archaeon]